jgi:azurin
MFSRALAPLFVACTLGVATQSYAKTCDLTIEGNDAMQYNTKEMVVEKGCTEVKVTLKHTGKLPKSAMGHNWVLSKEADMAGLVSEGMKAGLAADYIPKDPKVLASAHLVGGGETSTATFKVADLKAGEKYKYFCTFPGHSAVMNGVLTVK